MSAYWEKLKDPRWQRRRLEIMQRADFSCEECAAKTKTLNVHHKIYRKGADPWDYIDDELACLCEDCHEQWHLYKDRLALLLSYVQLVDLREIIAFGAGRALLRGNINVVTLTCDPAINGFALAVGLSNEQVVQMLDEQSGISLNDLLKAK